ncbi:MAG: DUF1080 domain-containing protein [Bryobacteraceae bacterium]|nr:DUF1080 domain-containing protein [Bryobacteraceae bacterium]
MRLALLLVGCLAGASAAEPKFVALFNGKNLKGWVQCNGKATYVVKDKAIVGTTVEGSPNSFLCTEKEYGDFVLEFEVKVDPVLNSGVQIRSHRYEAEQKVRIFDGKKVDERTMPAGRFYGYQVEIANLKDGSSGGIYDEARRGWLKDPAQDPVASKAFKDNEWNLYRVEAIGDRMRTWVNGVPIVEVIDSADLSGQIGLQVHSFKGEKPAQVRWRNIRIQDLGRHTWTRVWDGETMKGWTPRGGGSWKIEDGALHGASVAGDTRVGYLVSDESFKDLTVRWKTKITKGNSGFFVRTDPKTMAAYEVEIDAQKRMGGFWETGGRNWVTGPEDNAGAVSGDWNELTAHLHGHRIVFHLNGAKTVELLEDVKGRLEGVLALQVHGRMDTDVWFKDIEVLTPEKK